MSELDDFLSNVIRRQIKAEEAIHNSPATLPLQTVITTTMSAGSGPDIPPLPLTVLSKFDKLTSTTVDVYADNEGDGFEGPFEFTRK